MVGQNPNRVSDHSTHPNLKTIPFFTNKTNLLRSQLQEPKIPWTVACWIPISHSKQSHYLSKERESESESKKERMGFGLLASKVLRPTSRLLLSSQNPTIFLRTIVTKPQLCNPEASAAQRVRPPRTPDELSIEEEAERKVGWLLKTIFFVTAGVAGYHFFPYMGDNLMQQSISLLRVKDPLFKRMGASRLTRFATDDERRKKIIEMGGAQELLNMLSTAKDDRTRKAALQALDALLHSDEALASMHQIGAVSIIRTVPNSPEDAEVEGFKLSLMKRFRDMRYDVPS